MLIILSGCSGAGKNTIINEILKQNKDVDIFTSITTREMRPNEYEGNPFYYYTLPEFNDLESKGVIIEKELIHGNYYGTSYEVLDRKLKVGKTLIKDIGVEGTFSLIEKINDKIEIVPIFLKVPDNELKNRIFLRGEPLERVKVRAERFKYENSFLSKYEYVFDFLPLCSAADALENIIRYKQDKTKAMYATKKKDKISEKKVANWCNKLTNEKKVPRVKFGIKDKNLVIVKYPELLIASNKTGIKIKKEITNMCPKNIERINTYID